MPETDGWEHFKVCLEVPTGVRDIDVGFHLCRHPGTGTMDVDNVAITFEADEPTDCDSLEDDFGCFFFPEHENIDRVAAPCCPADVCRDGVIDFEDVIKVLSEWGDTCSRGDIDDDGIVGFDDLTLVLSDFGEECDGGSDPTALDDALDCMDIDETCWDDMMDTLENGTVQEQEDVICWIQHYESCHCPDVCTGGPTGCGDDPCGNH